MPQLRRRLQILSFSLLGLAGLLCLGSPRLQAGDFNSKLFNLQPSKKQAPVEFEAVLNPARAQPGTEVTLKIVAKIPVDQYIYSTASNNGAGTRITIETPSGLEAIDDGFVADHKPTTVVDEFDGNKTTYEKFVDLVVWTRKYKIGPQASGKINFHTQVKYQVCDKTTCRRDEKELDVVLVVDSPAAGPDAATTAASAKQAADKATADKAAEEEGTNVFEDYAGSRSNRVLAATWRVTMTPRVAAPGETVTLTLHGDLKDAWHIYALDQETLANGVGPSRTGLQVTRFGDLKPLEKEFSAPEPHAVASKGWDGLTERYYEGQVEFRRQYQVPSNAKPGKIWLEGWLGYQMCNHAGCRPLTGFTFRGPLTVAQASVAEPLHLIVNGPLKGAEIGPLMDTLPKLNPRMPKAAAAAAAVAALPRKLGAEGLLPFLITAILAGFAALLTPCVFPMIPITVSFFLKQSEKEHHRPVNMALVYCLGIMGTFTLLGLMMSALFGAASLNTLANNGWLNLVIAAVLIFFACNLLGMFEIRMPSWLLTYTSGKESRGGYIGVLFMALTFTLTSFTCTFAFAGLLLAGAANGERFWPVLGLLAFSAAFSLPFFFLALFPSLLKRMPKSGGWMNVVKVVMGLIELGAAFKFLSVADQIWHPQAWIFDYALVMSAWIVISIVAGLYLLGLFRTAHDTPSESIGVARLIGAMSFLGLAAYLSVGLFAPEKPKGKIWGKILAFAPPDFEGGTSDIGPFIEHGGLHYALDFYKAVEVAAKQNRPVFVDFTGVNCVNCRQMERGPMSQPAIKDRLSKFILVQVYTDRVPNIPDAEAARLLEQNLKLQEQFGDSSLPAYVVIPPDPAAFSNPERILAAFVGLEQREGTFGQFLDQSLTSWQKFAATESGKLVGQR